MNDPYVSEAFGVKLNRTMMEEIDIIGMIV
jgi:hypothetical protein